MEIRRVDGEGVAIAELQGCLDVETSPVFAAELERWVQAGSRRILVDLTGVDRVFSSGLSAMLALHRAAAGRGGRIVFAGARPFFREVLRITHLDRVLSLAPDRAAGLEDLRG